MNAPEHLLGHDPLLDEMYARQPCRFRKRPVEVEAMRFGGTLDSANAIIGWAGAESVAGGQMIYDAVARKLKMRTRDGDMYASPGDWVVREPFPTDDRRFYPCKADIFDESYEEVSP